MTEPPAGPDLPFWRNRAASEAETHEAPRHDLGQPVYPPPAYAAPPMQASSQSGYPPAAYPPAYQPVFYQPEYQTIGQPNPFGSSGYGYPPPAYSTKNWRPMRLVAIVIAALIAGGGLTWMALDVNASHQAGYGSVPGSKSNDPCDTPVPIDASEVGRQYLDAVAAATPRWEQVDATLARQGDVFRRDDLRAQKNADDIFVGKLRAIQFPANVQGAASNFISIVDAYDAMLQKGFDQAGYIEANIGQLRELDGERAQASSLLRAELNLPQSTCSFRRP